MSPSPSWLKSDCVALKSSERCRRRPRRHRRVVLNPLALWGSAIARIATTISVGIRLAGFGVDAVASITNADRRLRRSGRILATVGNCRMHCETVASESTPGVPRRSGCVNCHRCRCRPPVRQGYRGPRISQSPHRCDSRHCQVGPFAGTTGQFGSRQSLCLPSQSCRAPGYTEASSSLQSFATQ